MTSRPRSFTSFIISSGYAAVTAGSAGLLLVLLMAAARLLDTADYGRFSYALALATVVETVMDIGLGSVTVRLVARDRSRSVAVARTVLGLKGVWVGIGLALMAVVAPLLRADPLIIRACYLLGLSSAMRSYLLTIRGVLQGLDRFDLEALTVVADRVLLLVAGVVVMRAGYGLIGLCLTFVAVRLLMLVASMALMAKTVGIPWPSYDRAAWRDIQGAALALGFFVVAFNLATYIDTIMLGVMRGDRETGIYSAAYRIYEGLTYAPSILGAVLTPRLSYMFVHDRQALRRTLLWALATAAGLGVVLGGTAVLLAGPAVLLLFGSQYQQAAAPLQVLAGGAVFVFCTWILHAAAVATNLDRRLLGAALIGLVSNVGLNLLLIPRYGMVGSAWATVTSEALTVGVLLRELLRTSRMPPSIPENIPPANGPREYGNTEANSLFLQLTGALDGRPRVLEIGSGAGRMLHHLHQRGLAVRGVEIDSDLVAEAKHWYPDLPIELTTGVHLPFPDASFDVVLSFDVLEHIPQVDAHLAEVRRVLTPRGVYLMQTPNRWPNSIFETIRWRSLTAWKEVHCSLHTLGELTARLNGHGFDVQAFDVPVVNEFYRAKVRRYLGLAGIGLLKVLNLDRLPLGWRTNLYVMATRRAAS